MPNWCDNYVLFNGDEPDLHRVRPSLNETALASPGVGVRDGPPAGLRALYASRWTPSSLADLARRHPGVTATHCWYEPNMTFRGYAVYALGVRVRYYSEEGDDLSLDQLCVGRQLWPARYPLGSDHLTEANAAFVDPETWDAYRSERGLPPLD